MQPTLLLFGDKVFFMDANGAIGLNRKLQLVRVENLDFSSRLNAQQGSND